MLSLALKETPSDLERGRTQQVEENIWTFNEFKS